jgi:hypothetical protein
VAKKKNLKDQFPEELYAYAEGEGEERIFLAAEDVDEVGYMSAQNGNEPIVAGVYRLVKTVTVKAQSVVEDAK